MLLHAIDFAEVLEGGRSLEHRRVDCGQMIVQLVNISIAVDHFDVVDVIVVVVCVSIAFWRRRS